MARTSQTFRQYVVDTILHKHRSRHKEKKTNSSVLDNKTSAYNGVYYPQQYPCIPHHTYTYSKHLHSNEWMRNVCITMEVGKCLRGVALVKALTNVELHQFQRIKISAPCDIDMDSIKTCLGFHADSEETQYCTGHSLHKKTCCKKYPDLWTAVQEFKRLVSKLDNLNLINVCPFCWHGDGRKTYLTPKKACKKCCDAARIIEGAWKSVRAKRVSAACVIQGKWRMCISDPRYTLCRERLLREFGELI